MANSNSNSNSNGMDYAWFRGRMHVIHSSVSNIAHFLNSYGLPFLVLQFPWLQTMICQKKSLPNSSAIPLQLAFSPHLTSCIEDARPIITPEIMRSARFVWIVLNGDVFPARQPNMKTNARRLPAQKRLVVRAPFHLHYT